MSVFRELLAIKAFRESQAEAAVRVQRDALREAREAREAAEALLQRLLREGLEHEMQLYRDLCARIVRLREIEDVQLAVVGLRQREAQQQDAVAAAAKAQDRPACSWTPRARHTRRHRARSPSSWTWPATTPRRRCGSWSARKTWRWKKPPAWRATAKTGKRTTRRPWHEGLSAGKLSNQ